MKIALGHPIFGITSKFTDDQKKFLSLLETDEFFENAVRTFRKGYDIPQGGFNPLAFSTYVRSPEFKKINNTNPSFVHKCFFFVWLYNLPITWSTTFSFIVIFGTAIPPNMPDYQPIEIQTDPEGVKILIREQISKVKGRSIISIEKYLKEHREELEKHLKVLPKEPKIGKQNIDIHKRILELKKTIVNGKSMTDPEIMEELIKESDTFPFSPAYEVLTTERNRAQKYIKKVLAKDWDKALLRMNTLTNANSSSSTILQKSPNT